MDEPPVTEAVEPEAAFSVLSDETRIGILRELWDVDASRVQFSDLRAAVGVEDSGQFNYHLNELVGQFVRKTEEGYELTAAGIRVVGAVLGGSYTMEGSTDPIELEQPCPSCGDVWTFTYEDEFARLACRNCPVVIMYPVPPATFVGASPAEMPERTEGYLRALLEQLRNEICPYCDGPIRSQVVVREPPESKGEHDPVPVVEYDCTRCGGDLVTDLGSPLLSHPAVSAFYHERGTDVREPPIWQFTEFGDDRTAVRETSPLRCSVTFEAEGDLLAVTVDDSLGIVDVAQPR